MHPTEFYDLVKDNIDEAQEGPTYFYDAVTSTNTMTREQIWVAYTELKRDNLLRNYLTWKRKVKLVFQSIFTSRGRRLLRYRIKKYRRLKREGNI